VTALAELTAAKAELADRHDRQLPPSGGRELTNNALSRALKDKRVFTTRELALFGIGNLRFDDYIRFRVCVRVCSCVCVWGGKVGGWGGWTGRCVWVCVCVCVCVC
jgi:hypothetical protein